MKLMELNQRPDIKRIDKLNEAYVQFGILISELIHKKLPNEVVNAINKDIGKLNSISDSEINLRNQIKKKQSRIIKLIE